MNNTRTRKSFPANTSNAPKQYRIITVLVRIIDPKTEEVEHTHIKIIDEQERRDWLLSTIMWAVMNGKIAEVINKEDDKE